MTTPYGDGVAAGWQAGAGFVYQPLAAALVATCPDPIVGSRVLDAGSGAGAIASLVAAAGAAVVTSDLSPSMVAAQPDRSWSAVVADVAAMPVRDDAFDVAIAAFLINHLDPALALRELARVVRPRGVVLTSTWATGRDPVKSAIDQILLAHGWEPPDWYRTMQNDVLPIAGDPTRLRAAAEWAGLVEVAATVHADRVLLRDPQDAVDYRVATPHINPWFSTLDPSTRRRLYKQSAAAVAPLLGEWRPATIFLHGRVPGQVKRRSAAPANASA